METTEFANFLKSAGSYKQNQKLRKSELSIKTAQLDSSDKQTDNNKHNNKYFSPENKTEMYYKIMKMEKNIDQNSRSLM